MIDQIGKFWIVLHPTRHSVEEDILFESTIPRMRLQFLGGLTAEEIAGIYKSRVRAKVAARRLLKRARDV